MELTTEQGNRVLAESLGWRFELSEDGTVTAYHNDRKRWIDSKKYLDNALVSEHGFSFHLHWDNKLMTVVEKIESIEHPYQGRFAVIQCSNSCTIQSANFKSDAKAEPPFYYSDHYGETKKKATWLAVVAFLQWYTSLPSIDTNLIKKNKEG